MEKVEAYQTSDGEKFLSETEAKEHEEIISTRSKYLEILKEINELKSRLSPLEKEAKRLKSITDKVDLRTCPECKGLGGRHIDLHDCWGSYDGSKRVGDCHRCGGSGKIKR